MNLRLALATSALTLLLGAAAHAASGDVPQRMKIQIPGREPVTVRELRAAGIHVSRDAETGKLVFSANRVATKNEPAFDAQAAKALHIRNAKDISFEHRGDPFALRVYRFRKMSYDEKWKGEFAKGTTHIAGVSSA